MSVEKRRSGTAGKVATTSKKQVNGRSRLAAKVAVKPTAKIATKPSSVSAQTPGRDDGHSDVWNLRLYVAGQSAKCVAAVRNLNKFCEQHLAGRYHIEVVDLLENPRLARDHQILAVPTLVRRLPEPLRKVVGDLSNTERMLVGFDLAPAAVEG